MNLFCTPTHQHIHTLRTCQRVSANDKVKYVKKSKIKYDFEEND